jgi:hypothetical protein
MHGAARLETIAGLRQEQIRSQLTRAMCPTAGHADCLLHNIAWLNGSPALILPRPF